MNTPAPAPLPAPANRWSPQAVFGLLCIIGAVVVGAILGMPADVSHLSPREIADAANTAALGTKLSTALLSVGTGMVAYAPKIPTIIPPGKPGSGPGSAAILGALFAIFGFGLGGCAMLTARYVPEIDWRVSDGPSGPDSCTVELTNKRSGDRLGYWWADICPPELVRDSGKIGPTP